MSKVGAALPVTLYSYSTLFYLELSTATPDKKLKKIIDIRLLNTV